MIKIVIIFPIGLTDFGFINDSRKNKRKVTTG